MVCLTHAWYIIQRADYMKAGVSTPNRTLQPLLCKALEHVFIVLPGDQPSRPHTSMPAMVACDHYVVRILGFADTPTPVEVYEQNFVLPHGQEFCSRRSPNTKPLS